jgi:hypothetical protein
MKNNYFKAGGHTFSFDDTDYCSSLSAWKDACKHGVPWVFRPFRLGKGDPWVNTPIIGCITRQASEEMAMDEFELLEEIELRLPEAQKQGRESYVKILESRVAERKKAIQAIVDAGNLSEKMWMAEQYKMEARDG